MNWFELREYFSKSSDVLVKKLARNDCSWADDPNKHQGGVYIPASIRLSGFFPSLKNLNPSKPHIFESPLLTIWPATGETRTSNLKHYSNKGTEMHFTRVPKNEFHELTPASLLVGGKLLRPVGGASHWFAVLDSASEEAERTEALFDLQSSFQHGLFQPNAIFRAERDELEILIEELLKAVKEGSLAKFIATVSKLPKPELLASSAQSAYLGESRLEDMDPYGVDRPGDAIMRISRDIEYSLYKKAELRHRAAEVVRILIGLGADKGGKNLVEAVVRGFPALDATFLSASQHRKSRAGRSFEFHIARTLADGKIQFEEQAISGARRPDFVIPSVRILKSTRRAFEEALVLSAKTTLRERWKQVPMERLNCPLFLATVDDRVTTDSIADMQRQDIVLVVPESLKVSKETCYVDKCNVITFKDFFDSQRVQRNRIASRLT